jgi:hypothetical protein
MGKLESLKQLGNLGLNTPELLLEIRQFQDERHEVWKEFYSRVSGRISVRTERDGEVKCPHHPNMILRTAADVVPKLIREGYRILVFRGIDPQDAAFRGNYGIPPEGKPVIEWMSGPGTVRDLESIKHHSSTDKHSLPAFVKDGIYWPLYMRAKGGHFGDRGAIIEWSLYPYNVGQLMQKAIYWEIRPWQ